MNRLQQKELMEKLVDYQDSETGAKLSMTASFEHFDNYVVNADIVFEEEKIGSVIFTFLGNKNSVELSMSEMDESMMSQGIGTRYVAYATYESADAGADYICAHGATEVAENMYLSAGWEPAPSALEMPEEILALKL